MKAKLAVHVVRVKNEVRLFNLKDALKAGGTLDQPEWGREPAENWGMLSIATGDKITESRVPTERGNYSRYYQNVCDAIISGAPLDVSPQHALHIMKALEIGIESSQRGCTLPFSA